MASNSTAFVFAEQWHNPTGFLSLLMIIGGPVIQSMLAQVTGSRFVPACFSFGWISYAFSMIVAIVGDGRLMPPPDYACKVFNLATGYARTNRSWVIGRLLRDLERPLADEALCVSVYEAELRRDASFWSQISKSAWSGSICITVQLIIAILPLVFWRDWGILAITASGTVAALLTAALPQWRVEKHACRENSHKKIAITAGNGCRNIIVILGEGHALDLEDLAGGEGPRNRRPWGKLGWFLGYAHRDGTSANVKDALEEPRDDAPEPRRNQEEVIAEYIAKHRITKQVKLFRGLPVPFWLTRLFVTLLILIWAVILILVLVIKQNAWFLVAIGSIGMVQNAVVAAASRDPERRGIRLSEKPMIFIGEKVQDVLMDLDTWEPGCGRFLLKEFFPGGLDVPGDKGEQEWWDQKEKLDKVRSTENGDAIGEENPQEERQIGKYDEERYKDKFCGRRYDENFVEDLGVPSRGQRGGMRSRK